MNKNNLKRIAVFMAMMAALTQVKAKAHMVIAYGGPGLFEQPVSKYVYNGPRTLKFVKKKKFDKNPKIMVPAIAGGAVLLTGVTLLLLWGTGVIGKNEEDDIDREKIDSENQKLKGNDEDNTENIQDENAAPLP